jgi:hypothetical protein
VVVTYFKVLTRHLLWSVTKVADNINRDSKAEIEPGTSGIEV